MRDYRILPQLPFAANLDCAAKVPHSSERLRSLLYWTRSHDAQLRSKECPLLTLWRAFSFHAWPRELQAKFNSGPWLSILKELQSSASAKVLLGPCGNQTCNTCAGASIQCITPNHVTAKARCPNGYRKSFRYGSLALRPHVPSCTVTDIAMGPIVHCLETQAASVGWVWPTGAGMTFAFSNNIHFSLGHPLEQTAQKHVSLESALRMEINGTFWNAKFSAKVCEANTNYNSTMSRECKRHANGLSRCIQIYYRKNTKKSMTR